MDNQDSLMARNFRCPTCGAVKGKKCRATISHIEISTVHRTRMSLWRKQQQQTLEVHNALKGFI